MLIIFLITIIKSVILFLCLALGVGFYTLIERKVLSYIQLRKGPNKVRIMGLPQPLADAAKLFTKEKPYITKSIKSIYKIGPAGATIVILILWRLYISNFRIRVIKLAVIFFIAVSRINVFTILLSGWSSNSKYALLGAIRATAQTISYEIRIALIILSLISLSLSFSLKGVFLRQINLWVTVISPVLLIIWLITSLAETNRAPFDLAEGESELVSGFNIEYGGAEFALLFIAEYGRILFISIVTSCLFLSGFRTNLGILNLIKILFIAFIFLWVRGSFPRIRYDTLISLTWKTFLTLAIISRCLLIRQNI